MCLAIPGKVLSDFEQNGMRMARVQFGGIVRDACVEYVPERQIGDYVLVHVGFAISRIEEAEAERTYAVLKELDQLVELDAPVVSDRADESKTVRFPHAYDSRDSSTVSRRRGELSSYDQTESCCPLRCSTHSMHRIFLRGTNTA